MTTLAFRDGVLAGDRLVSAGSSAIGSKTKIARTPRCLYGATGALALCDAFMQWVRSGAKGDYPQMFLMVAEERFTACGVIITPKQFHTFVMSGEQTFDAEDFGSWGSGAEVARGALAMGASAVKAIKIAAEFDIYTGKGVDWVSFG